MIRRPPRSTLSSSSAASDVYKRQGYYLSSVLNGTTVSTVFEPSGQPLDQAVSAAVHIPADLAALYGIVALITIVVLSALFLFNRGFFRRAPKLTPPETKPEGLSLIHISEPTRLLSISYAVFC